MESKSFKNFNYNFSIWDGVIHKYTMSAFNIIGNDIYIPSIVGVNEVARHFREKPVNFNSLTTAKTKPLDIKMKHIPKDDIQRESIAFLNQMKIDRVRQRLLSLPTGSGKTFVSIHMSTVFDKKTMIIVDTLELAEQWKREILNHTHAKEEDIFLVSGMESVKKLDKKSEYKYYVALHKTIGMIIEEDNNGLNSLMNTLGIGLRIIDESHTNFKNVCQIESLSNVEYTIYLTATPSRSSFREDNLYSRVFKRVPYYNGRHKAVSNYHTVVLHSMNTGPTQIQEMGIKTMYGMSVPRWANYVEEEAYDIFYKSVYDLIKKFDFIGNGMKTVIMLPTLSLIDKLAKDLEKDFDETVGVYIGGKKKEERELALTRNIIITNDKMFEKGIDLQDLEVLINYVPFSSTTKLEQIIGRLRYGEDKKSIYIDVVDKGFKSNTNQLRARRTFYNKNAKKIIELK